MTDMVGKILHNRYKILRPVGVGGMAEVYLAQDMLCLLYTSPSPRDS